MPTAMASTKPKPVLRCPVYKVGLSPYRRPKASRIVNPLRVLICGPDLFTRVGLAALLADQVGIAVVGQLAWEDDVLSQVAVYQPDVILWDVGWAVSTHLDDLTGVIEAGYRIIILLPEAESTHMVKTMGVQGMLLRTSEGAALIAALRAVGSGLTVFDPDLLTTLWATTGNSDAPYRGEPLTPREQEVLQRMAQGLSNKLIARHLNITEHTVKFHVNAILGKLGAQSRTDAVVRATRAGLILL